ncbi:unnamed protein product [Cuscuta epithymum]|nr:unnamed protein product [Cuscuta epithymum]
MWGSNSIPLKENLIAQIKHHTQMWSASFSKLKRRKIEPYLLSEGLLTKNFRFGRPMFQIVRWIRPKGKDKLNVDASFLPGKSAGGAIFRDDKGELSWAVHFPLRALSSQDAEWQALVYATKMALEAGHVAFQVDTDSSLSLIKLSDNVGGDRSMIEFRDKVARNGIIFGHTIREGNWTAHALSTLDLGCLKKFQKVDELPYPVRKFYYSDYFDFPYFRI